MKTDGKQITFSKELSVKYSGKIIRETDQEITIEGEDEDSYVKVYTPFRGVAQLFLFENETWQNTTKSTPSFGGMDFSSFDFGNLPDGMDMDDDSDITDIEAEPVEENHSGLLSASEGSSESFAPLLDANGHPLS